MKTAISLLTVLFFVAFTHGQSVQDTSSSPKTQVRELSKDESLYNGCRMAVYILYANQLQNPDFVRALERNGKILENSEKGMPPEWLLLAAESAHKEIFGKPSSSLVKGYHLISPEQVKAFWVFDTEKLSTPTCEHFAILNSLDRAQFIKALESGEFDLEAKEISLRWGILEMTRHGNKDGIIYFQNEHAMIMLKAFEKYKQK